MPQRVGLSSPRRKAEENTPDRYRRVDQGRLGSSGHAHSEREGHVVRPHTEETYSRQGQEVSQTWPSVRRLEERDEREEQEPGQGEPHRHEGDGRELGDRDFDGHGVGAEEENRKEQ